MPVSKRRWQTSGGILGIAFPRERRINDMISMQMPRAVSHTRWKIRKAGKDSIIPVISRLRPDQV